MPAQRPNRRLDPYAEQFWEFTKAREFRLQRCGDCGKFRWPPAPACDGCLSEQFDWPIVSGQGSVLSWVTFRRQYFPEYPSGHRAVAIELDEGPLFVSTPVGLGDGDLRDGLRVEVAWEESVDHFGEYNLPVFKPLWAIGENSVRLEDKVAIVTGGAQGIGREYS